jgi:hydroxymethylpyrimidine/phosphomethylpyrimidine kinase
MPPVILTIAGFDPSSGAGVTADIKTIAAHGCYGISCITALTVQSTAGVREVLPLPADHVRRVLLELASDLSPSAIHIGMLGSGEIATAVADFLADFMKAHGSAVVLDPILRSSSGADLLDYAGVDVLRSRLLPMATVVTPNMEEAAALTGRPVTTLEDMARAANDLHRLGAKAVVVKGGHMEGSEAVDLLSELVSPGTQARVREFRGPKLQSRATHGTGCAFATALACNLALGNEVCEAVGAAKAYVADAIRHSYPLGHGRGPMHHLFKLERT